MSRPRSRPLWGRLGYGLKAFRMAFSGSGGQRWRKVSYDVVTGDYDTLGPRLPGANFDYAKEVGDPWLNSAVAICLGWIADNVAEPSLRVMRRNASGVAEPVPEHPLARLLARPNPFYDGEALLAATAMSYAADGNAYWIKARGAGGVGSPLELWYVPSTQIRPIWPDDGTAFLSGYEYRVDDRCHLLALEDVVHFRYGVDRANPRLGVSRLYPVLREIYSDNEANTITAALLRNMGIPSVLITPGGQGEIAGGDAGRLMTTFQASTTGELRGMPIVAETPMRVDRIGLSPEELALDRIRNVPEARICASLRLPAMVVGLSVGDSTRTYANYQVARRAAYEDCLGPMQRRIARTLNTQLLPDLGDPAREECDWDYSRVAALAPDLTEMYQRNNVAVQGGWMTPAEARALAGLPTRIETADERR